MIKILFVCTGNTCRSPMAELIFKRHLKNAQIKDVKVSSAGLRVVSDGIEENAKKALKQMGIRVSSKKSRPLTEKMIRSSNIVICMTEEQKKALSVFPNVFAFSELTDCGEVRDPYGGDLAVYVACARQLEAACEKLLTELVLRGRRQKEERT